MSPLTILEGDVLARLAELPDESVQCVVTSPPYWGLRDYGVEGQIGLEKTPTEYLTKMVAVFEEVRRVLRSDGVAWVNMGDSYTDGGRGADTGSTLQGTRNNQEESRKVRTRENALTGLKPKNLLGMPWRLAFALQAAGWYLRCDIIWSKPSPMPESVKDRPTRAHEYLFLLSKSAVYFYDAASIQEPCTGNAHSRGNGVNPKCSGWKSGTGAHRTLDHAKPGGSYKGSVPGRKDGPGQERRSIRPRQNESFSAAVKDVVEKRNKRSVWTIASAPFAEAHFATFPPALVLPCILAGSKRGDTVLDPFLGSGTTAMVALENGRKAIGIELNPEYAAMARRRCQTTMGLVI